MAYMNKETFDLLSGGDSSKNGTFYNIENFYEEHFFVDDALALPVQALNRKGYATEVCCSGHPFPLPGILGEAIKQSGFFHSFIKFNKDVTLPSLPPGFTGRTGTDAVRFTSPDGEEIEIMQGARVEKIYDYDENNVYAFMRDVLDAMEQLYQWALGLPDAEDVSE